MRRHRISRRKSRKIFTRGAVNIRGLNLRAKPMRGGFRI